MYEEYKVYGPYTRKDGRSHVILVHPFRHIKNKTVSYPRYLKELDLGRYLTDKEQVHHLDGDFTNNELGNLVVELLGDHQRLHNPKNTEDFTCPICSKSFTLTGSSLSNMKANRKRRKNYQGPYCSRRCAGRANQKR